MFGFAFVAFFIPLYAASSVNGRFHSARTVRAQPALVNRLSSDSNIISPICCLRSTRLFSRFRKSGTLASPRYVASLVGMHIAQGHYAVCALTRITIVYVLREARKGATKRRMRLFYLVLVKYCYCIVIVKRFVPALEQGWENGCTRRGVMNALIHSTYR